MKFHQQPATFVEHVQLKVTDINRSIEFYQKILGFDILDKTSSTANLTANGETAILTIGTTFRGNTEARKNSWFVSLCHFAADESGFSEFCGSYFQK